MQLLFLRKICTICSYSACIVQCFEYAREIQSSLWLHGACAAGMFFHGSVRPSLDNDTGHRRGRPPGATGSRDDAARKSTENASQGWSLWHSMAEFTKSEVQWSDQDQTQLVARIWGAEGQYMGKLLHQREKREEVETNQWARTLASSTLISSGFNGQGRGAARRCQALPGAAKRSAQKWDTPRLCAEDMLTHCKTKVFSKSSKECKAAKNSKQKSQTTLKKSSVNWRSSRRNVEQRLRKDRRLHVFVSNQLRATAESKRHCIEDHQKGYCPEGTAPRNSRDIDPVKGAKWFAIGYVGSCAGGWFLPWRLALIAGPAGPCWDVGRSGTGHIWALHFPKWSQAQPSVLPCSHGTPSGQRNVLATLETVTWRVMSCVPQDWCRGKQQSLWFGRAIFFNEMCGGQERTMLLAVMWDSRLQRNTQLHQLNLWQTWEGSAVASTIVFTKASGAQEILPLLESRNKQNTAMIENLQSWDLQVLCEGADRPGSILATTPGKDCDDFWSKKSGLCKSSCVVLLRQNISNDVAALWSHSSQMLYICVGFFCAVGQSQGCSTCLGT